MCHTQVIRGKVKSCFQSRTVTGLLIYGLLSDLLLMVYLPVSLPVSVLIV